MFSLHLGFSNYWGGPVWKIKTLFIACIPIKIYTDELSDDLYCKQNITKSNCSKDQSDQSDQGSYCLIRLKGRLPLNCHNKHTHQTIKFLTTGSVTKTIGLMSSSALEAVKR